MKNPEPNRFNCINLDCQNKELGHTHEEYWLEKARLKAEEEYKKATESTVGKVWDF